MTCCLGRWGQSLPCVGVFRVLLGPGLHPAGFRVAERRRFCRSVRCANGPVSEAVHGLCGRCPFPPRPCAYTWHEDRERGGAGQLAQLRATQVICGQNACSLGVSVGTSTRVRARVCVCVCWGAEWKVSTTPRVKNAERTLALPSSTTFPIDGSLSAISSCPSPWPLPSDLSCTF